jgi:hypothetical protein
MRCPTAMCRAALEDDRRLRPVHSQLNEGALTASVLPWRNIVR